MVQFENAVKRSKNLILDELHKEGVKAWIAGGSLRDYFMGVPIKTDYDIFFPSAEMYSKAASHLKGKGAVVKWESGNGMKVLYNGKVFDLIKKYFSSPQATIDAFDFTASMIAVDRDSVYHGETTFIDIAKKQLMINKITFPASSLSRAFRYHKKGFSICLGEIKKLYDAIQSEPQVKVEKEIKSKSFLGDTILAKKPENVDSEKTSSGDLMNFFTGID